MLARHRDPRVVPLEVWDLIVDGAPLYHADRGPGFGAVLARAAEALAEGAAEAESGTRFPDACRAIRRVVLAGGGAAEIGWTSARLPAAVAADGAFAGERGGRAILDRAGKRGIVADLGQSRLKVTSAAGRRTYARDLAAIPVSGRPVDLTGRAALIVFVAEALREAAAAERPEAIVLALPCEIGQGGALGTCSYPWRAGDDVVDDVLARAGLGDVDAILVNDAELSAIGIAEGGVPEPTLVLTIGFGVGGALIPTGA